MARHINTTLLGDGSSDAALKPILEWLLGQHLPQTVTFAVTVADLRGLPEPPRKPVEKLRVAWDLYPADILFLHRDAENEPLNVRRQEAQHLVEQAFPKPPPYIRVIPVRMTEAWLLGDETAIREAAGNPKGTEPLDLPPLKRVESVDAKKILFTALERASGRNARRMKSFNVHRQRHRLAELSLERGFSHLRLLDSFQELEKDVIQLVSLL